MDGPRISMKQEVISMYKPPCLTGHLVSKDLYNVLILESYFGDLGTALRVNTWKEKYKHNNVYDCSWATEKNFSFCVY